MSYDKINIIYMSYDKDENKFKEPYKLYIDEKKVGGREKEGGDIFDDFDNNSNSLNILRNSDSSFDLSYLYDNNTISDIKKYISKKLETYNIDIPFECQYLESKKFSVIPTAFPSKLAQNRPI